MMQEYMMSRNAFAVLDAYEKMHRSGEHMTLPQMASAMGVKFAPFKKAVEELRKNEFLVGQRKIVISDLGKKAHESGLRALQDEARRSTEAAATSDPIAAASIESAQPGQQTAEAMPSLPSRDDRQLSEVVASQLRVTPDTLWKVIKNNVISISKNDTNPVTDAEVMHVLTVMHKYALDPFVRQMYAFRHKGKLQVAVAIDGWVALANRCDSFEGVEYEFPMIDDDKMEMVGVPGTDKKCWPWVKATCHVLGRKPTVAYAFLDEWFTKPKFGDGNWEKYPTHRLKMKAYTLAVREALGIALYDEADREQFLQADWEEVTAVENKTSSPEDLLKLVNERALPGNVSEVEGEPAPTTDPATFEQ